MTSLVDVGVCFSVVSHGKRRLFSRKPFDLKTHAPSAVDQVCTGADQAFACNQFASSSTEYAQ